MRLPLGFGFGIISVCAVVATAIAVSVLAISATRRMIEDNVSSHTESMREFGRYQVETYFESMASTTAELQTAMYRHSSLPFISEDVDANKFDKWWSLFEPRVHADPTLFHIILFMYDNSLIRTRRFEVPAATAAGNGTSTTTVVTSYGWDAHARRRHLRSYHLANFSAFDHGSSYPFGNANASTFPALLYPRQFIAENPFDRYWMNIALVTFPTEVVFPAGAVIYNNSGAKLGVFLVASTADTLNKLLQDVAAAVDGALAVVVDSDGYIAATSHEGVPSTNKTFFTSRENLTVSRACGLSQQFEPDIYLLCRRTINEYSADTLPELRMAYDRLDRTRNATSMTIGDFYVEHRRLKSSVSVNFVLHLYVLYPKRPLLANVERVINIVIVVAVCVATTFTVLAVVSGNIMVRPLGLVSQQLGELSRLKFTMKPLKETSVIREVSRLQEAAILLTDELLKISAFVPMNLRENHADLRRRPRRPSGAINEPSDGRAHAEDRETEDHAPAFVDIASALPNHVVSSTSMNVLGKHGRSAHSSGTGGNSSDASSDPPATTAAGISTALLNRPTNTFAARKFAYISVVISAPLDDSLSDTGINAGILSSAFLSATRHYRGVVEVLEPRRCAASFGAHHDVFSPQRSAAEAAASIAAALQKSLQPGSFSVVADCAVGLIGAFGNDETRTFAVFGDVVRCVTRLHDLCQAFLPVSLVLTERVAGAITRNTLVPIDVVRFFNEKTGAVENESIVLFTVVDAPANDPVVTLTREVFAELRSGNLAVASEERVRSSNDIIVQRLSVAAQHAAAHGRDEYFRSEGATRWEAIGDELRKSNPSGAPAAGSFVSVPPEQPAISAAQVTRTMWAAQDACAEAEQEPSDGIVGVFADREIELPTRIRDMAGEEWERARLPVHVGKTSSLYHAFSTVTGAPVVLKVLPLDGSADTAGYEREVVAQARLSHECVVTNVSYAAVPGYFVLIRELVPGGSLAELLAAHGTLCQPVLRRYLRDVVLGLQHLHQHDVLHLDIRPGTVLLGGDGRCKLTGFASSDAGFTTASRSSGRFLGRRAGRPPYIAPEIARGEPANGAADIYSLGILALELHLGNLHTVFPDFRANCQRDAAAFASRLAKDRNFRPIVPNDSQLVPEAMVAVIVGCLEVDPSKRPTAAALLKQPYLSSI